MSLISRVFQPSIIQNERDYTYRLNSMNKKEIESLLSTELAMGGVFGVEHLLSKSEDHELTHFAPIFQKVSKSKCKRIGFFNKLKEHGTDITIVEPYLMKPSMFPIDMNKNHNLIERIVEALPNDMSLGYQLLLAYRQDNWKEDLEESYIHYLNGVENPSSNKLFRNLQVKMNDAFDNLLKYDFKHADINEIDQKIDEHGFRFSLRFVLYGAGKNRRVKFASKLRDIMNEYSYMNKWEVSVTKLNDMTIQQIQSRKMDNLNKSHVLTVSELVPFMITKEKVKPVEIVEEVVATEESPALCNPLDMLPSGKKIKSVNGKGIDERFVDALIQLNKIKKGIQPVNIDNGSTILTLTYKLPNGLKLSDINKKTDIENIQTLMGEKNLSILQGNNRGEFDVWIPKEERQVILLRNYIDNKEFKKFAEENPLPFLVGVDMLGKSIYKCLSDAKHLLIAGSTGSGKSVFISQLLLTLLTKRTPSELQMYMIDLKLVELKKFKGFPHVRKIVTDAEEAHHLLKQLINEMHRRYKLFEQEGVNSIAIYNNKTNNEKLPYIVLTIDEFAELNLQTNGEVIELVQSLAQLARACGIHLIIATQQPTVKVIPSIIKSNLPSKIAFRCSSSRDYLTILDTNPPYKLLGKGDGTMTFEGQLEEHMRFQGCLIIEDPNDENLEAELIEQIAESMKHKKVDMLQLPEVEAVIEKSKEEIELEKLKQTVATTQEVRVAHLQRMMKININRLKEHMQTLVDEGWLEAPETKQSGYKLIADEEVMSEWRQ